MFWVENGVVVFSTDKLDYLVRQQSILVTMTLLCCAG